MRTPALALLAALPLLLAGCDGADPYVAPTPTVSAGSAQPATATATLDALQHALARGDGTAAAELGADPAAGDLLAQVAANVTSLRLDDVTFRYLAETGRVSPEGDWTARVETTWRLDGLDRVAARAEVEVAFADDGGAIAALGGGDGLTPLWLRGPVAARRTAATLVLASGGATTLGRYRAQTDAAVAAVRGVLGPARARLVVEVPESVAALHQALGAEPGTYDAVAAVTASADGSQAPGSPLHVFLNPAVYGDLDRVEAQVVMTHEAVHVATEAPYAQTAPLWLLEGFADYVALRDLDLPITTTAGQVIEQVRQDGLPAALPDRLEFDTRSTHLGAAYEAAWLACVTLADRGGEDALVAFYDSVIRGDDPDAGLERHFGWTTAQLTAAWRDRLSGLVAASAERA